MSNAEHYFENLLFHGHDITGEPNKKALSKEAQDAVEQCVNYIKYSGASRWINHIEDGYVECPVCGHLTTCESEDCIEDLHYCFWCGTRLEVDK